MTSNPTNPTPQTPTDRDALKAALYGLIGNVARESERFHESKGRMIRVPMDARIGPLLSLIDTYCQEREKGAALDELEAIMKCWEHPSLAPYFLTDRIAQLSADTEQQSEVVSAEERSEK